jgi:dephospho-CoA kinase
MLYIGLTGNIASGKTEVAQTLADYGATLIDADVLAREAVAPGTLGLQRIVQRWGPGIIAADGTLDRTALRHLVFSDREQLNALNEIVHPEISTLRDALVEQARARGDAVVVYAVPLLFERNLTNEFDKIILVDAPRAVRLDRLIRTREIEPTEAMNMIASQMPAELKRARADIVIDNGGSLEDLRQQVRAAWKQLTAP